MAPGMGLERQGLNLCPQQGLHDLRSDEPETVGRQKTEA